MFVYNPFSLLTFFWESRFANYWFATGTPSFLVNRIRREYLPVQDLTGKQVFNTFFDKFNLKKLDLFSLLFQTGYLTIKKIENIRNKEVFTLGYPNNEVRESFIYNLIEVYNFKTSTTISGVLFNLEQSLFDYDMEVFIDQLKILFSNIAYQLLPKSKTMPTPDDEVANFERREGYFQTVIYLVLSFMGINIQCEVSRHKGRLDALVDTDDYLYLLEFKVGTSAETATDQIKKREYAAAYKNISKKIILLGIVFDKQTRNIKDWKAEEWLRS